jgi:hypothetical protein
MTIIVISAMWVITMSMTTNVKMSKTTATYAVQQIVRVSIHQARHGHHAVNAIGIFPRLSATIITKLYIIRTYPNVVPVFYALKTMNHA